MARVRKEYSLLASQAALPPRSGGLVVEFPDPHGRPPQRLDFSKFAIDRPIMARELAMAFSTSLREQKPRNATRSAPGRDSLVVQVSRGLQRNPRREPTAARTSLRPCCTDISVGCTRSRSLDRRAPHIGRPCTGCCCGCAAIAPTFLAPIWTFRGAGSFSTMLVVACREPCRALNLTASCPHAARILIVSGQIFSAAKKCSLPLTSPASRPRTFPT